MAQSTPTEQIQFSTDALTPIHWAAITIAGITGIVHVWLYTQTEFVGFAFAAVVFVLAVVGVLLDVYRPVLYALGIPFTAGQILFWFVSGMEFFEVGIVDKILQSILIVLLAYLLYVDWWVPRRGTADSRSAPT